MMGTVILFSAFLLTTQSLVDAHHRIQTGVGSTLYSMGTLCGKAALPEVVGSDEDRRLFGSFMQ